MKTQIKRNNTDFKSYMFEKIQQINDSSFFFNKNVFSPKYYKMTYVTQFDEMAIRQNVGVETNQND